MLMDNILRSQQSKHNDRYCKTIPNNDIVNADKYLLVHNHPKNDFALFHNISNNSQSKLSFYGFQSLQTMPKRHKYRYNFDEHAQANVFNQKRNDIKLQIIEERINNLETRNEALEHSNQVFFNVFNEIMKSAVYRNKYITRNMSKFKEQEQEKIKQMLLFAHNPNNEFDAEGNVLAYHVPGILDQMKKDIVKLIAENSVHNNSSSQVFNTSINKLKNDLYRDIESISNKQKEHMDLLREFVNYNSVNKELSGRMMTIHQNPQESSNKSSKDQETESSQEKSEKTDSITSYSKTIKDAEENNPPTSKRRKKKGKSL